MIPRLGSRWFMVVASIIMAFEGIAVMAYGAEVVIDGWMTFSEGIVLAGGAVMLVMGAALLALLAYDIVSPEGGILPARAAEATVWAIGAVLMITGIMVVINTGSAEIAGVGGVRAVFVSLFGAQLFVLGLLGSVPWFAEGRFANPDWFAESVGLVASCALLIAGLMAVGASADGTIGSIGGFSAGTMMLAGLQLTLLGGVTLLAWLPIGSDGEGRARWLGIVVIAACAVVALEGALACYYASPVTIDGFGSIRKSYVSTMGAALTALSLVILTAWFHRDGDPGPRTVVQVMGIGAALLFVAEGQMLFGVRGAVSVEGLGGFQESTMALGTALMAVAGLALLACWWHEERPLMFRGRRFVPRTPVLLIGVIVPMVMFAAGAFLLTYAETVTVSDWGVFGSNYVLVAGAQLLMLSIVAIVAWVYRDLTPCCDLRGFGVAMMVYAALVWLMLALA